MIFKLVFTYVVSVVKGNEIVLACWGWLHEESSYHVTRGPAFRFPALTLKAGFVGTHL